MQRRSLYNSLRMNWILDPTLDVAPWQVEDYRKLKSDQLFSRLQEISDICLDKDSFKAFAEAVDTPEDLTDDLLIDLNFSNEVRDQVYLILFELWRRILPERKSLSIFCDELDRQICLYDEETSDKGELLDILDELQVVIEDNIDSGISPKEAGVCIQAECANQIDLFLRDYLLDLFEDQNNRYAKDLIDGLGEFLLEESWNQFFHALLLEKEDPKEANDLLEGLIEEDDPPPDLELNFEILGLLARIGEKPAFLKLIKRAIGQLEIEDDFQTLLICAADFFHRLDQDFIESALLDLLQSRKNLAYDRLFQQQDKDLDKLKKIIPFQETTP